MIRFENYTKKTLKKYANMINSCPYGVNDISLGTLFAWHKRGGLKLANYKNTLIIMQTYAKEPFFTLPYGEQAKEALGELVDYAQKENMALNFYCVTEESLKNIKHPKIRNISYSYNRDWSDYVYSVEEIASFKGKKFAGQRNHINKFNALYENAEFSPIEEKDLPQIEEMLAKYDEEHPHGKMYEAELKNTYKLLNNIKFFNFLAFKTVIGGKIASFTIGELVNETLIIHVEKALRSFKGVYPYTFNKFASFIKDNYPNIKYINREDDSGQEGLRISKTQYQPIKLLHKYYVKVNSPIYGVDYKILSNGEISIDRICEADKPEYNRLCLDDKLNALWGYDYTEDVSKKNVTFDTFYDMQLSDYESLESMSFAVRLNGKFIGETVLYNFTTTSAELGIRLLPEYHGKGYGKIAYALTRDFALANDISLVAKCYKQNTPSYKTITACGFKLVKEDKKFYYFKY